MKVTPALVIQLKKRQQKKAAESGGPISDVASVPSRTSTPAPSECVAGDQKRDNIEDVYVFYTGTFRLDGNGTTWGNVLFWYFLPIDSARRIRRIRLGCLVYRELLPQPRE
jgi:hypothetical protein